MKFTAKILDLNNIPLQGNLESTSSPANYFAACVYLAVDLMNGGSGLGTLSGRETNLNPELASQSALPMFISTLHEHPAFAADRVIVPSDPNYSVYQEIACLLSLPADGVQREFLTLLSKFKVPGIKSITIQGSPSLESKLSPENQPRHEVPSIQTNSNLRHASSTGLFGVRPGAETESLKPGERVQLNGLINKPELNGKTGKIVQYFPATGRYSISLDLEIGDTVTLQHFTEGPEILNGKKAIIVRNTNNHFTVSLEHQGNTVRKTIINPDHISNTLISVKESNLTVLSKVVAELKR